MKLSLFQTHSIPFFRPSKTFDETRLVWTQEDPQSLGYIEGSLQEVDGKTMQLLPEGIRSKDIWAFYTDYSLNAYDEHRDILADYAEYLGKTYEVHQSSNYKGFYGLTTKYSQYFLVLKEKK